MRVMKTPFLKLSAALLGLAFLAGTSGCANCWKSPYFGDDGNHKRFVPKEVQAEHVGY